MYRIFFLFLALFCGVVTACNSSKFSAETVTKNPQNQTTGPGATVGSGAQNNQQGPNTGATGSGSGATANNNQGVSPINGEGSNPANGPGADSIPGGIASIIGGILNAIPSNLTSCSTPYLVPASANPYMAGMAQNTTIPYVIQPVDGPNPIDSMPLDAPVLVTPTNSNCITAGTTLYFNVSGAISYAASTVGTDANGFVNQIVTHQKGGLFGKSDIAAPMSSLLGVFLSADDPSQLPAPPALDFSNAAARNYDTLLPQLGQVFFIGNGRTTSGALHKVVVPQGATRLYFALMDTYQWNNNPGGLTGSIMVAK